MKKDNDRIVVSIQCLTYNHVKYIRQCLDGFLMQQTDFRFEAIVHDDASTDGTADVVREYAEKYPDIVKPILEKENVYSKHIPGLITKVVNERCQGKYIAMCEGDDYWTDPLKLQKQVDYMEVHPECSLTCNRTKWYSEKHRRFVAEQYCRKGDGILSVKDVVYRRGLYIATCSVVIRESVYANLPFYCKHSVVGDYPLQIFCALNGCVYYFDTVMSVYRRETGASFMDKVPSFSNGRLREKLNIMQNQLKVLDGFMQEYPQYQKVWKNVSSQYINKEVSFRRMSSKEYDNYVCFFSNYITKYPFLWKLDLLLRKSPVCYFLHRIADRRFMPLLKKL